VFPAGSIYAITEVGIVSDPRRVGSPPYAISYSMYSTIRAMEPIISSILVGFWQKVLDLEISADSPSYGRVSITALHSKIYGATSSGTNRNTTLERNRLLIDKYPQIPGLDTSSNRFTHPFTNTTSHHVLNPIDVHLFEGTILVEEDVSEYMTRIACLLFINLYNTEQIRSVYGSK